MLTEFTAPDLSKVNVDHWIAGLGAMDYHNEIIAMTILSSFGKPLTALDVGSGTGALSNTFRRNGIDAHGIDRLPRPEWDNLHQADLAFPFRTNMLFDLVTSIEVAEHLPESAADGFCESIAKAMKYNGRLIFTAAPPGQPGDGHVNCQPAEYWRKKFHDLGILYADSLTWRLALALSVAHHPFHHIEANLQVFINANTP